MIKANFANSFVLPEGLVLPEELLQRRYNTNLSKILEALNKNNASETETTSADTETTDTTSANDGNVNISTNTDAQQVIDQIKEALREASEQRHDLGAEQNRLDHTVPDNDMSNYTVSDEGIKDVDMVDELINYNNNVPTTNNTETDNTTFNGQQSVLNLLGSSNMFGDTPGINSTSSTTDNTAFDLIQDDAPTGTDNMFGNASLGDIMTDVPTGSIANLQDCLNPDTLDNNSAQNVVASTSETGGTQTPAN